MFSLFSKSNRQGFTLVELVVVMAIFTIMTIVVMANLPAFRSRTSLDLLAEEVAITIRQAQVFGVGTRVFETEFPSYGVYFSIDPQSFVLFADSNSNGNYKYDGAEELREQFQFRGGVGVTKLEGCFDADNCQPIDNILQIVFHRPEADALFNPDSDGSSPDGFSYVRVTISSVRNPDDGNRRIIVWNTGHIYACNPNPILNPTSCS